MGKAILGRPGTACQLGLTVVDTGKGKLLGVLTNQSVLQHGESLAALLRAT